MEVRDLYALDVLADLQFYELRHNIVSWDVSQDMLLAIAGKNVGYRRWS